jgi:hypothetical protein
VAREYATEWALERGTFDWRVLNEKRTHPTQTSNDPFGFGPTSVILCHGCVDAVAYVKGKCLSKVKISEYTKKDRVNIDEKCSISHPRRNYSREFQHRNIHSVARLAGSSERYKRSISGTGLVSYEFDDSSVSPSNGS